MTQSPHAAQDDDGAKSGLRGHQLDVILAEYNALRAEIQSRSGYQTTFVQLHIAALTAILGTLASSFGAWTLLLIPLEATIFGFWYLDHAHVIEKIGEHIWHLEERMGQLVEDRSLVGWETQYRARPEIGSQTPHHVNLFRTVLRYTFDGPAILALVLTFVLMVLSLVQAGLLCSAIEAVGLSCRPTPRSLPAPMYPGWTLLAALMMWGSGVGLLRLLRHSEKYRHDVDDRRRKLAIERSQKNSTPDPRDTEPHSRPADHEPLPPSE